MESFLFYLTITLLVVVIAINLVIPYVQTRRYIAAIRSERLATVKRLYGPHYQRNHSLTSGKR